MADPATLEPTKLTYLEDTYLFELTTVFTGQGIGTKGQFLTFSETILYPKGGGQPSDFGRVQLGDDVSFDITYVEYDGASGVARHFIKGVDGVIANLEEIVGSPATLHVDSQRRLANARAHTAGHLLADVVSSLAPELQGKLGNHDPIEGCYVKFHGLLTSVPAAEFPSLVNAKLAEILLVPRGVDSRLATDGAEGSGPEGKARRLVQIEGFEPSPCGGTHIRSLAEISSLICTKAAIVKKENVTKISYTVA